MKNKVGKSIFAKIAKLFIFAILTLVFHVLLSWKLFERVSNTRESKLIKKLRDLAGIKEYKAKEDTLSSEGLKYDDVYINSRDGKKLHGVILEADADSDLYVICIHDILREGPLEFSKIAKFYHELGVNVLITDLRGFGKSAGDYTTFGFIEARDHMEWTDYLIDSYGSDIRIVLHGIGVGAATVLMMCRYELSRCIKGVVVDGSYSSLKQQLRYSFNNKKLLGLELPEGLSYFLYKSACFNASVFDPERTNPCDGAEKINIPVIFVSANEDPLVSSQMTEDMYEMCPSINKKLITVSNGGHLDNFENSSIFRKCLMTMIQKLK